MRNENRRPEKKTESLEYWAYGGIRLGKQMMNLRHIMRLTWGYSLNKVKVDVWVKVKIIDVITRRINFVCLLKKKLLQEKLFDCLMTKQLQILVGRIHG